MKEVQALKEQNTKTVALEEMVQNLSEQKVDSATEIDKLRNETLKLKQVLEVAEASQEKHERQFKRINDENEELLEQVDSLDKALQAAKEEFGKIGLIQQERDRSVQSNQ